MKLKQLLKQFKLFNGDREQLEKTEKGLSKVLEKLKQKELLLKNMMLAEIDDEEREQLQQELIIIDSQSRKGMELLARIRTGEEP